MRLMKKKEKIDISGIKLPPREYQIEASEIAFKNKQAVIVMPTGTGKTLIGLIWAKNLLKKGLAKKILVLEPTRILVEQIADFFRRIGNIDAQPIHGLLSREVKEMGWRSSIVVTTPEEVLFHEEKLESFEAVLVDECHHAVGEDAYKKVLEKMNVEWRLGLSAHIPKRHRATIENLIGSIYEWSIHDPKISPYVPDWIGEIYECPLDPESMEVYKAIEELWKLSKGKQKMLYALALRFLARDGALALKDSLSRKTNLTELLDPLRDRILRLPDLHKLDKLYKTLEQHEFIKAIIFVDRVIVARRLYEILREYNPVLVIGRRKASDATVKQALERAKSPHYRIIISTSAGEEGIDLPSADLLILWSNVVSPLRFIQRHGRILRKTRPLKYVAYLVTPDTVDLNAFLDSIEFAKKAGIDIGIEKEIIYRLAKKSPRASILDALEKPMPIDWLCQVAGLPESEVRRGLKLFLNEGELIYLYTPLGRTILKIEHIPLLVDEYPEYFQPEENIEVRIIIPAQRRKINVYGRYPGILNKLMEVLKKTDITQLRIVIREIRGSIEYVYTLSYNFRISDPGVLQIVILNALSKSVYRQFG